MEKGLRKRSEWNAHGGTWGAGEMGVRSPDNSFTLVAYLQCFITKSGGGGQEVRARRDPKGKRGAGGAGGGLSRERRGTVLANTGSSQVQNCKRPADLGTGNHSQDGTHVRLVLRPLLSQVLVPMRPVPS